MRESTKIILHPHSVQVVDNNYVEKVLSDFSKQGFARLPNFLSPAFKDMIEKKLPDTIYKNFVHNKFGKYIGEEVVSIGFISSVLNFALNSKNSIEVFRPLIRDANVDCFHGRHYKYSSTADHLEWHSDRGVGHLAISINLMPDYYLGGNLEFKPRMQESDEPKIVASNKCFGDAILFLVNTDFVHRVVSIKAGSEKVAFAGWFDTIENSKNLIERNTT